jgi:hypothetical protein
VVTFWALFSVSFISIVNQKERYLSLQSPKGIVETDL